mmetsp:Transcript_68182/g.188684  ORF Transcript_68182/g.188684 Transcript_68182/m.188684 type:complete len:257 (-) Transcript_68182:442-1212(-)
MVTLRKETQIPALQPLLIAAQLTQVVRNLRRHISVSLEAVDRLPHPAPVQPRLQLIARHPLLPTLGPRLHDNPGLPAYAAGARGGRTTLRTHPVPLPLLLAGGVPLNRREAAQRAHVRHVAVGAEVHLQVRLGGVLDPAVEAHVVVKLPLRWVPHRHFAGADSAGAVGLPGGQLRAAVPAEPRPAQQGLLQHLLGRTSKERRKGRRHNVRLTPGRRQVQQHSVVRLPLLPTLPIANHGQLKDAQGKVRTFWVPVHG